MISYASGRAWFSGPGVSWWLTREMNGYKYEQLFCGRLLAIPGVMDDYGNLAFVEQF